MRISYAIKIKVDYKLVVSRTCKYTYIVWLTFICCCVNTPKLLTDRVDLTRIN
jgi:hypothetical protein